MLADLDSLQIDSRLPQIVPFSTKGEGSPLLFVHDVTGTVDVYYRVVELLNPDRPCFGIHAPAYTAAADAGLTIEAMASSYLKASRSLLTADGDAVLAGFSLGGMIAYEMARQHAESGGRELPVLMVDITVSLPRSRLELTRDMMLNLPAWLRHDGLKTSPWALVQRGLRRVHKAFAPNAPLPSSGIWAELLGRPVAHPETTQVMLAALRKYVPPPYSGPVVLLRGKDRHLFNTRDPALGWSAYAQNLRTDALPGSHDTWILDEKLPASVEVIRRNLDSFG
jgi:thioesterase domain-containing protein